MLTGQIKQVHEPAFIIYIKTKGIRILMVKSLHKCIIDTLKESQSYLLDNAAITEKPDGAAAKKLVG